MQVPAEALSYVESQPWPFPRSQKIALRGKVGERGPTGGGASDGAVSRVELPSSDARAAAAASGITQQEIQE